MNALAKALGVLAPALSASACATLGGNSTDPVRLEPGDTVDFGGETYRLVLVQDDFVLLRYVDPGTPGALSGFMDEVMRVSRYHVRQGRWNSDEGKPELRMQWAGGDAFVLDRPVQAAMPSPAMGL